MPNDIDRVKAYHEDLSELQWWIDNRATDEEREEVSFLAKLDRYMNGGSMFDTWYRAVKSVRDKEQSDV